MAADYLRSKQEPQKWAEAKLVAQGHLIAAAQARRLVTYTELGNAIEAVVERRMGHSGWSQFLGELVPEFYGRHGVALSALLVRVEDLTPSSGLVDLARENGWVDPDESEAAAIEQLQAKLFTKFSTA